MSSRELQDEFEKEVEEEAEMQAAFDTVQHNLRHPFASKAEERRFKAHQYNADRRNW